MKKLNGILLIDDDETNNFLNHRLLTRMNLSNRIRVFQNGKQAFDYLYSVSNNHFDAESKDYFHPELILLDINMPVMDGFEFLDLYNKLDAGFRKGIRLAVLTTSSHLEDTMRAEQYHAQYVTKPLTQGKIKALLAEEGVG